MNKQAKEEQKRINEQVLQAMQDINNYDYPITGGKQLRSSKATVYTKGKYKLLVSYDTPVAFIDTETDTLYDVLRCVYGYTATSAQHISKFDKDYGAGKWGCAHRLTYYDV